MNVGLLGHGVVGTGVTDIADKMKSEINIKRILVRNKKNRTDKRITTDFEKILNDKSIDTIVECMGGIEPAHTYVLEALKHKKNVVTANKKMLATYYAELHEVAEKNHVKLFYEASVGGGIPWLAEVRRIRQIDKIESFRGIFNGTTNYILSAMQEKNVSFDEVLKEAQKLGYAEQDPTDDICGYDVRFKSMISVASCFDVVLDPSKIMMYGIQNIKKEDIAWAKKHHLTIKFIGQGIRHKSAITCCVFPCALKEDDVLTRVNSNLNGIEVNSTTLGKSFYIGQGAGSLPTAHAIVQDLFCIKHKEENPYVSLKTRLCNRQKDFTFYVRTKEAIPEEYISKKVSKNTVILKPMKLRSLKTLLGKFKTEDYFVMEVPNDQSC